jgi:hypothetical protein
MTNVTDARDELGVILDRAPSKYYIFVKEHHKFTLHISSYNIENMRIMELWAIRENAVDMLIHFSFENF